ncbi:uncharacterized protein BDV14DRAFT_203829 [Aspergillus stella-maris]|uniref:uncharacterized protein n=1 Tax=Aspergillus stella-maris TaxID=1810926 RepID=UPI003CCD8A04
MDVLEERAQLDNAKVEIAPPKPRSVALGLTRAYATDWKVKDALRELYQNWKDAILQTYAISLTDFVPILETTPDEIRIIVKGNIPLPREANRPMTQDILGYIRFNKMQGSVEFTNLRSTLDEQCLELGTTTKSNDDRLIGGHGEGLKIAALVLCRENHHVKISANGCYWNFGFNGTKSTNFYCRLAPAKGKRVLSGLAARVREDVSVLVEKGHTDAGRRLQMADFGAWMRETLDLHVPSDRVRTLSGDLLLGQAHRGHLYLKGIRVPHAGHNGQTFYFGYNLLRGNVDRDRQRLVDGQSVAEAIHSIWNSAILHSQSVVLPKYIKLLRCDSASADAVGADEFVSEATARKMWAALSCEARINDGFYYQNSRQTEHEPVIRTELKKQPRPLSEVLWKILRRYSLVREPMEELQHQFRNSRIIELPNTAFAQGLARTLQALMALDPRTATIKVVFVRCDIHTVDLAYSEKENMLYVHEKWLELPTAPSLEELEVSLHLGPDAFFCQHMVEKLYRRTLAIVFKQSSETQAAHDHTALLELSHQKLRQMPRMIEASLAEGDTAVRISFYTGHSHAFVMLLGARVHYLVALHITGCSELATDLIYRKSRDICNCPRASVALDSRTIVFQNLNPGMWVPMVVKQSNQDGTLEEGRALKAQDGALIEVFPQVICVPHRNSTDQYPGVDAPHDVLPNAPFTDKCVDFGTHRPPSESAVLDCSIPTEDSCQKLQVPGQNSTAEMSSVPELNSTALACDDLHIVEIKDDTSYSPTSPLSDPGHSTTLATEQLTCRSEPTPSTQRVVPAAGQDSITNTLLRSEVAGELIIKENSQHYATPDSICAVAPQMPAMDTAWWKTWAAQNQCMTPQRSRHLEKDPVVDGPWQLCDQYDGFHRGTYVQAIIAHVTGISTHTQVLFIHNIIKPLERSHLPAFLVVTRYSFLVDHPVLKGMDTGFNRELLLHFRNANHMAEEGDAEIIAARDVTLVEADDGPVAVKLINQESGPVPGFFARFAVWDSSPKECLFTTSLGPYLFEVDRRTTPYFTALPVASVFDLSPEDTGLSIGFARAGYRIRAAIGVDEGRRPWWKVQHPDAAIYSGDAVSVIMNLGSQGAMLSDLGDHEAPRVVIISSRERMLALEQSSSDTDTEDVVSNSLESSRLCVLAAESPILSPDFIVLALLIPSAQPTQLTSSIISPFSSTIKSLLARGYSVTLRSLPNANAEQTYLVLLAAPLGTNPQWIEDSLSDLQVSRASSDSQSKMPDVLQGQGAIEDEATDAADHPSMIVSTNTRPDGLLTASREHIYDSSFTTIGRDIATILTRVIGEFSKQSRAPCSSMAMPDLNEAQDRIKRQKV